jgi:uncharacterized membrane protein YgcG
VFINHAIPAPSIAPTLSIHTATSGHSSGNNSSNNSSGRGGVSENTGSNGSGWTHITTRR